MEWAKAGANIIMHSSDMFLFADKLQDDMNCIREVKGEKVSTERAGDNV
jgi:4-hydroxy-2-oxoheptanedioate aldolase